MRSADSAAISPATTVDVHRMVTCGSLIALGVVLGLVETWLVAWTPMPWIRLGLGNVAAVVALAVFGPREALSVAVGRVLLVGIATGTLAAPAGLLSMTGALFSIAVMCGLSLCGDRFSVIGWSAAGAAAHTAGQFLAAVAVMASPAVLRFLPLSIIASLALGVVTGQVARMLLSHVPYLAGGGRARYGATNDRVCE